MTVYTCLGWHYARYSNCRGCNLRASEIGLIDYIGSLSYKVGLTDTEEAGLVK